MLATLSVTFVAVLALLLIILPGYAVGKTRLVSERATVDLTKILLFVCSPCMFFMTFQKLEHNMELLWDLLIFALLVLLISGIMLAATFFILFKRQTEPLYRIVTIATALANCAFFGIPIIEALYENADSLIIYTSVWGVTMNILGWTVVSAIIAHDKKYMSAKKIILNPATLGGLAGLLFFLLNINLSTLFPSLWSMVEILGRASSPVSMLIVGLRLSGVRIRELFDDWRIYVTIAVKQLLMPLVAFMIVYFLPLAPEMKQVFVLLAACPVAAIVQSFSEMLGKGEKEAAKLVLLGTILSIVTLPVASLLLPLLA